MHSIGVNEKVIFLFMKYFNLFSFGAFFTWFILISMCVLSICQILIVNFIFFSYKYDIALVVCATHLLVFDFLHLLGVSKST